MSDEVQVFACCSCDSCLAERPKIDARIATNARQFEREFLAAKLEAELLHEQQGDDVERAYRRGWNARAMATVRELRGGK